MKLCSAFFCLFAGIIFISCNNSDKTKTETTDTTQASTDTSKMQTMPASTIVTTPQNMVVVTHRVKDFAKWLPMYEGHDTARVAAGLHSYVIGRGAPDSNLIIIAMKADDWDKAKAFANSKSLKEAMQKGGVISAPAVEFVTELYQDTGTIQSTLRSRTEFTVKDWNTWKKSFDSTKQIRTDNGLMDRVVGHDAKDDKKVTIVMAVTDSTKAAAFWKSDQLKKIRAASGVVGEPKRFVYNIVKKY